VFLGQIQHTFFVTSSITIASRLETSAAIPVLTQFSALLFSV